MIQPVFSNSPSSRPGPKSTATAALLFVFTFASPALHGIGFRSPNHDAHATARGSAFVATADNPSAVYHNPAALTELEGTQVSGGSYFITVRTRYEAPDGETTRNKREVHAQPHFYLTHNLEDSPFALGVGLVAPFGLSNEWPDDVRFRERAIEGSITYVSLMPTLAYKINPQLSIGGGPTLNYGEAELVQGTLPGERSRFEGDDTSIGFHLGIRWQPHEKHVFGAKFRSHDNLKLDGSSNVQPSPLFPGQETGKGRLPIPEYLTVGYSYRPTEQWNLEANIDWTRWSRLDNITLETPSFATEIPFNWKSSFMYFFGATRYLPNGYHVSAGYIFSENSVPDKDFSPLTADEDRHLVTTGFGRRQNGFSWDIAAQIGRSPTRRIPGDEAPADGKYRTNTLAGVFTLAYSF